MHLRPERLKTLLGDRPSGCPGQGLGPVAVPDTLEGGGGSLRHSRRRGRLSKAFQEGAAAQGTPGGREGGREGRGGEAGREGEEGGWP